MEEPILSQEHLEQIFTLIEQTPTIELFDETFMLGSYTYAQMRQAIYQQAKKLTSSGSIDGGVSQISKPLSGKTQGFIQLMLDDDSVWAEEQDRRGAMVTLTFYQTSGRPNTVFYQMDPLVELKVPGAEPVYSLLYRFWDERAATRKKIETEIHQPKTPEKVKYTWLSIRCVCKNMRTWTEPGVFWPEEI